MYEDEWIEEIILENIRLRKENNDLQIKLEQAKKKHNDFIDEMFRNTQSVTASWVKFLLDGDIKIATK